MNPFVPAAVDLYHGNTVVSFRVAKNAGLQGVIHKATQGTRMTDQAYAARRVMAANAGLLWGAYHFADGSPVAGQVDRFITAAKPDDKTLMALDFEDNPRSNMSVEQLYEFLELADAKLGRKLVLYGGNRIKELAPRRDPVLGAHKLWLCQYGKRAVLPASWDKYFLWQYAADGEGPEVNTVPGIPGHPDVNRYDGDDLAAEWSK